MSLIDDIGNAISRVASEVGNVVSIIATAIVDVIISAVDTIAGLFRRLAW